MKLTQIRCCSLYSRQGFSLVEVVLALGIVAFALVTMLGVFGKVIQQRGETRARKEVFDAVNSLQSKLNEPGMFDQAYEWVRSGARELVYVRYRVNSTGQPDTVGTRYRADWLEAPAVDISLENAMEGRWIKVKLEWDDRPNINLLSRRDLPNDPAQYTGARAILRGSFYPVSSPGMAINTKELPAVSASLSLNR